MARKKSKRKPAPKPRMTSNLPVKFSCPFCFEEDSCNTTLDKKSMVGFIECQTCRINYKVAIHSLSEPIDVYNEWIDKCDTTNKV
ncbi:hypothetical protein SNEBB_001023 [Seison nebaliae]|nr:hypothetical protein SNEBB_001023 [Seison nebaliae]